MMKRKFMQALLCFLLVLSVVTLPGKQQEATAATVRTPVVFVHGLYGSDSNFFYIRNYLLSQGWSSNELYSIDLPSKSGNQSLNSAAIASFVDDVLRRTGSMKVNLIGHSMGGANSLYYILYRGGSSKVDKLVTLGGANSLTTRYAPSGNDTTSIYTNDDRIVANSMSYLIGANNIEISGVSHIGLISSSKVNGLIRTALLAD
jgi:triacylglycerol lipase